MRRNTKFIFTQKADRPALSPEEARYWKALLEKICKVGFEYEYNLEESRGSCAGNTFICPCSHPLKETRKCYAQCANFDTCKLKNKHGCPGIDCIVFASPCSTCKEAVRDCARCELFNDPNKQPATARKNIETALQPTMNLADPGKTGAFQVTDDGSLLGNGGVEVTTVGRRVSFDSFLIQAKNIVAECEKYGAYVNERTSVHMHLVGGYFNLGYDGRKVNVIYKKRNNPTGTSTINEMEKPMPEIILANFHQLVRRYHNALTWITSSGTSENTLTRWAKFRRPVIHASALRARMPRVISDMCEGDEHRGHYMFMNYSNVEFNGNGEVKRLHLEGRFADGTLSPTAIAAYGILLYALMIKAVALSQHGLLHSGSREYMDEAYEIRKLMLNNEGGYGGPRTSDTSRFAPYKETVRRQAEEMINVLHSELRNHGKALKVLQALADKPCSIRRIEGQTWPDIERELSGNDDDVSASFKKVVEAIDTFYIDDCRDEDEWAAVVSEDLDLRVDEVKGITTSLVGRHSIVWDKVVGTYVRC